MVQVILEQVAAGGKLVAFDRGNHLDTPLVLITETGRLVEGQVIDSNHLGGFPQGDAVPAEEAGDLNITRKGHDGDEDEVGRGWETHNLLVR
jgi:hypothetical protein